MLFHKMHCEECDNIIAFSNVQIFESVYCYDCAVSICDANLKEVELTDCNPPK